MLRRHRDATGFRGRLICSLAVLAASAGMLVVRPAAAQQLGEGMDRSGTVEIRNDKERALFSSLNCSCGTCPHEQLSTCPCGFATEQRDALRAELAMGKSIAEIQAEYAKEFGAAALNVPPDSGANRLVWLAPLLALVVGAGAVGFTLRRWRRTHDAKVSLGDGTTTDGASAASSKDAKRDEYDERLDQELKDLDDG